ncbi:hypothetical protein D3C75_611070 [compost metagenome]
MVQAKLKKSDSTHLLNYEVCPLNEKGGNYVSYTTHHEEIVNNGVIAINDFLANANDAEKRSLLFCLD